MGHHRPSCIVYYLACSLRSVPALLLMLVDGIDIQISPQAHSLPCVSHSNLRPSSQPSSLPYAVAFTSKTCANAEARHQAVFHFQQIYCSDSIHTSSVSDSNKSHPREPNAPSQRPDQRPLHSHSRQGSCLDSLAAVQICTPSAPRPPIAVPAGARFETDT